MIELVTAQAWRCKECGWMWFPRKNEGNPKRCPKRECRKLASFAMPIGAFVKKYIKPAAKEEARVMIEEGRTTLAHDPTCTCFICKPPKEKQRIDEWNEAYGLKTIEFTCKPPKEK